MHASRGTSRLGHPVTGPIQRPNPRTRIQHVIARACTELPIPPPIELVVTSGPVTEALVEAARDADLLVVGQRRRSARSAREPAGRSPITG